ncbi:MAG TPA: type II toxin-antitoxin system RelE/ParE family toxin [Pirellulales bacterium]
MATIVLTAAARDQASELPAAIRARIYRAVERLVAWPNVSGAKPLRGRLVGQYRLRTGDYRIQFHVAGETVYVQRIGHRDRFYD